MKVMMSRISHILFLLPRLHHHYRGKLCHTACCLTLLNVAQFWKGKSHKKKPHTHKRKQHVTMLTSIVPMPIKFLLRSNFSYISKTQSLGDPGSPGLTFKHLVQLNTLVLLVPPQGSQVQIPLSYVSAILSNILRKAFSFSHPRRSSSPAWRAELALAFDFETRLHSAQSNSAQKYMIHNFIRFCLRGTKKRIANGQISQANKVHENSCNL